MVTKYIKPVILSAFAFLMAYDSYAQIKVGNNPTSININSVFEMEHTTKGMLLPRIALTGTTSFAPLSAHVAGMVVYNTATVSDVTPGYYYNDGVKWVRIAAASTTTNTLSAASSALTSTVNGVASTLTPSAGTIASANVLGFDASGNLVKGAAPTVATTNTLTGTNNNLTSTVNGVAATLTPSAGTVTTKFLGFDASGNLVTAPAVTAITNTLTGVSSALTSTVNGVAATLTPSAGIIASANTLGFDASGNLVKGTPVITTTNTLAVSNTAITSTVNGVAATANIGTGTIASGKTLGFDASNNLILGNGASFDSTTASNGLTLTGKDVRLGGTLTSATSITTSSTNTLKLLGLQNSTATTDSIVVVDATGVVKKRSITSVSDRDLNVTTQTGNYTASATDDIIIFNGSTGGLTLTLPTTGIPVGKKIYVTNISNQDWQLSPTPINGGIVVCQGQVGTLLMYVGSGWATLNAY